MRKTSSLLLALTSPIVAGSQGLVRDPATAPDGRLVVSIDGDLYLRRRATRGPWMQLTTGAAWDRQPSWSPDGRTLYYASARDGNEDIFSLRIEGQRSVGSPTRLTSDVAPDARPVALADGAVLFVRGSRNEARLWIRTVDGSERRVTTSDAPESEPAATPDGRRFAYIQSGDAGRRLRLRGVGATWDSLVTADRSPGRPVWSPDGQRLLFVSETQVGGLFVTPSNGRYVNFVADGHGDVAWTNDGKLLLAYGRREEPGYNGDPDRAGDRSITEWLGESNALTILTAPAEISGGATPTAAPAAPSRQTRNGDAFTRVAERLERLYFTSGATRDRWRALVDSLRPAALRAPTDFEFENVLHELERQRPLLRTPAVGRAAVSSAHPVATQAGLEILRKGGNVVDAAAAVSFALGVVEPDASGVGGYGEMLVHISGMSEPVLLEFMARVPEEATLSNASLQPDGRYPSDGPILAMVPGTVAAMHTAWRRFGSGKVSWADIVAPAIRAARDGYEVSEGLATTLRRERERFAKYESSRALFFKNGSPRTVGDTIRNPDLAWTLEQIARSGADGFYRGEVARRLVSDLRGKGNAIKLTDLSRYYAAERAPVRTTYRGLTLYSSAPPASGGATLAAQLNSLELTTTTPGARSYADDSAYAHAMIAAWQLAPSARGRIADPSLWPTDVTPFVSKDTARARWRCFDATKALSPSVFRGDSLVCPASNAPSSHRDNPTFGEVSECQAQEHAEGSICRAQGTTAFVVADADGNTVAVTQTLGTWGGNFYVSPGLGFLYNDKLTSYGTDPNAYGARLPYARHGSTLAPTIAFEGSGPSMRARFAVGAAGNAWITSAVYQTLVGLVDYRLTPQQALELPRFLPSQRGTNPGAPGLIGGGREYVIDIEDGYSPTVIRALTRMGYRFNRISLRGELRMGYGAAIAIGDGAVQAGADPRRAGAAGAIPERD